MVISGIQSDLANSMLSSGTITSFGISAVDFTNVGFKTRYKITFLPVHTIPSDN
jgi:hypothetical protein